MDRAAACGDRLSRWLITAVLVSRCLLQRRQPRAGRVRARTRSAEQNAPQLMNVVREMAIAANCRCRASTSSTTPRRTRSPPAATQARQRRHHHGPAPEARPRGAPGRHRPRALARPQPDIRFALLVGVLVGSIALLADFFLRFTFWSGVAGGRRSRDPAAVEAAARSCSWSWPRPGDPRAVLRPARPARREPPARVPRRRLERRADPQPVRPGAGAGQDRSDQEVLEVANRATQHLYIVNPIKKFEARARGPDVDPSADRRPHQPAPRS